MENYEYSAYSISSSSQSSIAAQQTGVCAADSRVEEEKGGGGQRVPLCSPSALPQIVPIAASIYTVFHSVIFHSVKVTYNSNNRKCVPLILYCKNCK